MDKLLVTRKDAARMLSISVDMLDDLKRQQKIRCVKIGARSYYSVDELRAFVQRLRRRP